MTELNASRKQMECNWEEKKLAALLEAASIAIKRARYVFIIINVSAILIFSAEFNALVPWMRWPIRRESTDPKIREVLLNVFHRELEVVSVPLLGIKFSASDLTVIGSPAMMILAIWFYYCVRRENLVVKDIKNIATKSADPEQKSYLYYGIAHYFVYTTATGKERPAGITSHSTARWVIKMLFYVPCWMPILGNNILDESCVLSS